MLKSTVIIPLLLIYSIVSYIIFKQKHTSRLKYLMCLCFSIYLALVIAVTLFPIPINKRLIEDTIAIGDYNGRYNLIPFKTILGLINNFNLSKMTAIKNIAGNILLLMPLGFLVPLIWHNYNKFKSLIIIGLLSTLSIEIIQLLISTVIGFQYKSFDVDDIILNLIGFVVGVMLYKLIKPLSLKVNINIRRHMKDVKQLNK